MSTIKPVSVFQLKQYADKLQISDKIIEFINTKLEYNAKNYGLIGANISFKQLISDTNWDINSALVKKLQEIYIEYTITYCTILIYIKPKEIE